MTEHAQHRAHQPVSLLVRQLPIWFWLILLLLLVTWLGARGLNQDALWYDEWLSVYYAGGAHYGPIDVATTWERLADRSTWPPGFPMVLSVWGSLVGWQHLTVRVLALFLGLLTVAGTYRLGRGIAGRRVGVFAAVVLGLSALFIYYLHELRGYTLATFLVTLCIESYWRIIRRPDGGWGVQIAFLLSVIGLLYTHYFASFTLIAIGLYHLLFVPKNRAWWRPVVLLALGGLAFLPWLGVLWSTVTEFTTGDSERIVAAMALRQIVEVMFYTFSNGSLALLALIAVYALQVRRRGAGLIWFTLLAVLIVTLLVNERAQVVFHIRHLLIVWPLLALITALGIERLGLRPLFILAIWGLAGIWNTFDPAFVDDLPPERPPIIAWDGFHTVLTALAAQSQPDDVVGWHVETPDRAWLTEPVVDYYMHDLNVRYEQLAAIPGLLADEDYRRQAQAFFADAPHVWLVRQPDTPSPYHVAEFQAALAVDYAYCGRAVEHATMTLDLYARVPSQPAVYHFGQDDFSGIEAINLTPLRSALYDQVYEARLWWALDASVPRATYSAAIHLLDANGQLVAQADYGLPTESRACVSRWIDLAALPPGTYTVAVSVYAWQDGTRLLADDGTDHITLDTLTIP